MNAVYPCRYVWSTRRRAADAETTYSSGYRYTDGTAAHAENMCAAADRISRSHLATAIDVKVTMALRDDSAPASQLNAAMADLSLERLAAQYVSAGLIILDELGLFH